MTEEDLAQRSGIDLDSIFGFERGDYDITPEMQARIDEALTDAAASQKLTTLASLRSDAPLPNWGVRDIIESKNKLIAYQSEVIAELSDLLGIETATALADTEEN
jgi:hypothetical protein